MGDKNEHLRAVAEDYGLPVEVAGKALERAAAELTARQAAEFMANTRGIERLRSLEARFETRLAGFDLPVGGFTTPKQAADATTLGSTLRELQKLQRKMELPVTETPERVFQAEAMASAFRRHHDAETGALIPPRPRGRPRHSAADISASF
jgi:hypothetical protein